MTQANPNETALVETSTDRVARKLEVAREKAAARAGNAADAATDAAGTAYRAVKDHPIVAIGGAIVLGAVVAQFLPGRAGKRSRDGSRRAIELAAIAADMALSYGKRAGEVSVDAGREGASKLGKASQDLGGRVSALLRDLVDDLGEKFGETSDVARKRGEELAEVASDNAREAGKLAARKLRELADKLEG